MSVTLFYQQNTHTRAVLKACPTLQGRYKPPPWARSAHTQIAILLAREQRAPKLEWDITEYLTMPDGGLVSVQWHGLKDPRVTAETPVLLVLPTICGNGDNLKDFIWTLQKDLGWPVAVCNRRGHIGVPLTTPRFNTLGDTHDLDLQIRAIQKRRPSARLFAVGISAGSGLLVRYLGERPEPAIRGGIVYGPGYDLEVLFDYTHPTYSKIMAGRVQRYFLQRNAHILRDHQDYDACASTKDLSDFHRHHHRLAGFQSRAEYLKASNPMVVVSDTTVPMLIINAIDDPICNIHMVRVSQKQITNTLPQSILAVTKYGSHCAHFDGQRQQSSWARKAMVEYLNALREVAP